jgi:diguanylate cyclase (GGDEF)-like protein
MIAPHFALSDFKISIHRNPIQRLIIGGAGLIAAIAIGTTVMATNFRERALGSIERELANTVLLLAHHLNQQFEEFEVVQNDLIAHMRSTGITSSDDYKRQMSSYDMHEMLKAKSNGSFDVAGVNIFDADGTLVNSSKEWPLPTVSIADRDYFRALKSNSASTSSLIELVQSRLSGGARTALIARKLTGANGEFLGLVTRGIATVTFEKFFAPLALGNDAVISMLHRDGTMLARYPHIDNLIGQNFSGGPLFQILSNADHGSVRKTSQVDDQDRLGSIRQLSDFPIVVVATTSVSAALADWRAQTRLLMGVAGLLVTVIAVLLFLIVRQLSRQHEASRRGLAVEKQRLDTAINNMAQGLMLFDASNRLIVCNRRYFEMFHGSSDVVKPGCTIREILQHRKETGALNGDVDEYCANLLSKMAKGEIFQTIFNTVDGRLLQILYQPLAEGGWVTTLEDVTERRRSEERITHLAHYDALTDLPNRVLFHEHLKGAIARIHPGEQVAVLCLDIDEFKSINDSLGHLIGDELLKAVAASLSGCLGKTDFVARLGGDEFAVIQTGIKYPDDVVDLVRRIYVAIREPHECLGHQVMTDASVGIALAPRDGTDLDQILQNADLAMYSAKADGRRTHRFFKPAMDARAKARRTLEMDLRQAIIDGGFEVHYQPIVDLRNNQISGCEALLRWRHPKRGMISPAEFIPVAEETGLIDRLGEWVLATACVEAATWPAGVKLAVNVSPVQFRSDTLALKVVAALAASGLTASRLELEITETVLIRDDATALAILHQLRALGVAIALDDFGTGYSSLSYLQRFPFDKIKIDRCFIKDIAESADATCIVKAVVSIAEARHIKTTAEGVETEQQREMLRGLGCTEMQGYLFSPAKPAAEIRRLLHSQRQKTDAAA